MRILALLLLTVFICVPRPAEAMGWLKNCPAKMQRGFELLDQANTCAVDSDCVLTSKYFCECVPLAVNKNADLRRVDIIQNTCQSDILCEPCGPSTDMDITLRCEHKKCVRYVDGKSIDR